MNSKLNLLVLFGGRSGEHEVSLMSARSVLAVLDKNKYNVIEVGITHQGEWVIGENLVEKLQDGNASDLEHVFILPEPNNPVIYQRDRLTNHTKVFSQIDVVFPVLHGSYGEDGTLQGLLEMADVAYVGAGVLGSSVGMDKSLFKDVMKAHGIPVVESITCTRAQIHADLEQIIHGAENLLPYPLFVKPANLGSSVGISKCKNRSDLMEGILDAARYDRRILIEKGINAREIEVSVLGNAKPIASLPGEVVPSDEFYSYKAKYIDGKSGLIIPAELEPKVVERIQKLAIQTYLAIDCAGMARVDFLVDKNTLDVYINEVNTIPGFTSISMYPKLWEASGLGYAQLIDRLIELAIERKHDRDRTERQYGK